jgi:hypothetical protein
MSLQEFKSYVENSGEDFDSLNRDDKIAWKESFDRSRGKLYSSSHTFIPQHASQLTSVPVTSTSLL